MFLKMVEIIYKVGDFPDPGDRDVYNGIQEINMNNYREALKHFEKGSNYDNEYALLFSAIIYLAGFGLEKREPRKAMNLFKRVAADWKTPVAQYLIGEMCLEGDEGVPQNQTSGAHWMSLAAESGWPYAISRMGIFYFFGDHVKKDHKKAIIWFKKLTKNDDNETEMIKDETFYLFGNKNFEVDFTHVNREAMILAQKALEERSISPVESMRGTYKDKILRFDDHQRILIWNLLTKKKSSGVMASQIGLKMIYLIGGSNVPVDHLAALHWEKMAAKNGHADSAAIVNLTYVYGLDTK